VADAAQFQRAVEADVLALHSQEHARLEVLRREREMRADARVAQRGDQLQVPLGGVLGQVEEDVLRIAGARLDPADLAHEIQISPAHAVVGIDDVEVRDAAAGDEGELLVQPLEGQFVHAAVTRVTLRQRALAAHSPRCRRGKPHQRAEIDLALLHDRHQQSLPEPR
jgi:hypothetical protein